MALLLICSGAVLADQTAEVIETFANVANALTQDYPDEAIRQFDPSMPGYEQLKTNFFGLTEGYHINCTAKIVSVEESGDALNVSLRWTVTIRDKNDAAVTETRTKTVAAKLQRNGKKWKIVTFEGVDLFDPRLQSRH